MLRIPTKTWMTALAAGGMALSAALAASPAHAACGTYSFTPLDSLGGSGFDQTCGDVRFYDFSSTTFGVKGKLILDFSGNINTLKFEFDSSPTGTTTYKYFIDLLSPTKDLVSVSTSEVLFIGPPPTTSFNLSPLPPSPGTQTFEIQPTLSVNAATTLDSWTTSIVQTPAPLPILGVGAAFGFSRKLRKRIKSAT